MKKFTVTIEELISQSFEIEAENEEQAEEIAIAKYKAGEIVLEDASLLEKNIAVFTDNGFETAIDFHSF